MFYKNTSTRNQEYQCIRDSRGFFTTDQYRRYRKFDTKRVYSIPTTDTIDIIVALLITSALQPKYNIVN